MKINDLQALLLQSYQGGKFAHIKRIDDFRDCEDLIFKGLFNMLGDECILDARAKGIDPAAMAAQLLGNVSAHVNAMIPVVYTGVVPMSAPAREPAHT